jgi:hypothetical protein
VIENKATKTIIKPIARHIYYSIYIVIVFSSFHEINITINPLQVRKITFRREEVSRIDNTAH